MEAARDYALADEGKRREAAVSYLFELADIVTLDTGSEAAIAPLLDVIPFVANPGNSQLFGERRSPSSSPSGTVLARAAASIDIFTLLGYSNDDAAQQVARQLINARVRLPEEGDDVRGWKRLLSWRDRLVKERAPDDDYATYVGILRELTKLPRRTIIELANDGRLWNSRAWRESTG